MGDPAGIGPEICLRALREPAVLERCTPVLFGDADVLKRVAGQPELPRRIASVVSQKNLKDVPEINEPLIVDCARD